MIEVRILIQSAYASHALVIMHPPYASYALLGDRGPPPHNTRTIFRHKDGPNHLGLWSNAIPEHQNGPNQVIEKRAGLASVPVSQYSLVTDFAEGEDDDEDNGAQAARLLAWLLPATVAVCSLAWLLPPTVAVGPPNNHAIGWAA